MSLGILKPSNGSAELMGQLATFQIAAIIAIGPETNATDKGIFHDVFAKNPQGTWCEVGAAARFDCVNGRAFNIWFKDPAFPQGSNITAWPREGGEWEMQWSRPKPKAAAAPEGGEGGEAATGDDDEIPF